ncbi:SCO-spondin [Holothuria leucospilota]|uniref:SCO-spondin n=1 Tax=Holothuria leucospilota TaxID=206669 RepID=A0A9Q0YFG4_HOLLE|nr:SCO-spondin [Holothuria leucospilota]
MVPPTIFEFFKSHQKEEVRQDTLTQQSLSSRLARDSRLEAKDSQGQEVVKEFNASLERIQKTIANEFDILKQDFNDAIRDLQITVAELTDENKALKGRCEALENKVTKLEENGSLHASPMNKQERFSRRKNLRIVGLKTTNGEDCIKMATKVFEEVGVSPCKVERAHRDGKIVRIRDRHVLVKLSFYQDKVAILKKALEALATKDYYIIDDLTQLDLKEKRRWSEKDRNLSTCDGPLTLTECTKALTSMQNDKSPGTDGLSTDFYKHFWPLIGHLVVNSLNYAFDRHSLSHEQCRSIITLIRKPEKDYEHLTNYRPISLLNTDYKIGAKALANRLKDVIHLLIGENQTGFIKGKLIGENIRFVLDLIDHTKNCHMPGFLFFIDFEKAFDSVDWIFLENTLRYFNFGSNFREWVQTLYNNSAACVLNNGYSTGFFSIYRGVRQGCPLSPYLFILCVDILARRVYIDDHLRGIKISGNEIKISQYADDTTFFMDGSKQSLDRLFHILNKFKVASGLNINYDKSYLFPLGSFINSMPAYFDDFHVNVCSGPIKYLGVYFTHNGNDLYRLNYLKKLSRLKSQLRVWNSRDLTPIGRNVLVKSFGISQLVFLFQVLPNPPDDFFKNVENYIFEFIWNGNPDKVKRNTMINPIEEGGLKDLNLHDYIDACYADVCETEASARDGAECSSIAAYVQECSRHLGAVTEINWRTDSICPYPCQNGSKYMSCPSICDDNSCHAVLHCEEDEVFGCLGGCRCPPDQFLKDGVCTSKEECPCEHRGKTIPNGDTITDDCNTCECSSGELQCTEKICPATCTVAGYAHHRTFDNKQFSFQGDCEYIMLTDCWNEWKYDTKYEIRAENSICQEKGYSCIKAVVIEYGTKIIRVAIDGTVTNQGVFITDFPHVIKDIYIDNATKNTTIVHLGNGVTVRWDRFTTMAIEVKPEHYNRTCGLCGTFNKNQKDDFYTYAGDTESVPQSFGNKWKYTAACRDVPLTPPPDSCSTNTQWRRRAEATCEILNNVSFTDCHALVSPSTYIKKCKTDVCSCTSKEYCHCAMIAEYASECYRKGVKNIDWRAASPKCAIDDCAKDGLIYTQCLPSCQSSCAARFFSSEYTCHDACIEGCVCPFGQIKGFNGTCIEPDKCHCTFNGELFASGERRMERCGVCTCENGSWQCDLDKNCTNATCGENEEYVACLTPCPKTCDNANNYQGCSMDYDNCTSGCQCQSDKVLHNGLCIPIESCPCEHSGLTYQIGDRVKETDCTEIICSENGWISKPLDFCPGKCSAYGNTHIKTFDSKTYDFQGDCEYIFAETIAGADAKPFHIIIKNIPCGLHGITCTKSIEFIIGKASLHKNGDPGESETIFLVKGRPTPATDYPISGFRVIDTGTNVVVLTKIGVTLVWHKDTFLEVQLAPDFKNKV